MDPAVIAFFGTIIGAAFLFTAENYFMRKDVDKAVSRDTGWDMPPLAEKKERTDYDCAVYDQRAFERRMISAGIMNVEDIVNCGDQQCINCFERQPVRDKQGNIYQRFTYVDKDIAATPGYVYKEITPEVYPQVRGEAYISNTGSDDNESQWAQWSIDYTFSRAMKLRAAQVDPDGNGWGLVFLNEDDKREYKYLYARLQREAPQYFERLRNFNVPVGKECSCDFTEIQVDQLLDSATIFRTGYENCPVHSPDDKAKWGGVLQSGVQTINESRFANVMVDELLDMAQEKAKENRTWDKPVEKKRRHGSRTSSHIAYNQCSMCDRHHDDGYDCYNCDENQVIDWPYHGEEVGWSAV